MYKDPNDPRALEARRKHYYKNKDQYQSNRQAKKELLQGLLREVKATPCTDCGVQYPYYVMQLDHLPSFEKIYEPAQLVNCGSVKKFWEEVEKCEVVCANCHAERTHVRRTK